VDSGRGAAGRAAERVEAELLDRTGKVVKIPVASKLAPPTGDVSWAAADVSLAPLATGDLRHPRGEPTGSVTRELSPPSASSVTHRSRTVPTRSRLPGLIWILGVVSLCMDTSSELVHALLPIYMTTVLGAGMVTVGVIEGVAEATASIVKVFSGSLSDAVGSRKWLVVAGYGLAALTKPVFPLAASVSWVFGARFVDRGKGIRGAPRDALSPTSCRPTRRGLRPPPVDGLDCVSSACCWRCWRWMVRRRHPRRALARHRARHARDPAARRRRQGTCT
jgi:hypothetical protein